RELLDEKPMTFPEQRQEIQSVTPEIYLGYARAEHYLPEMPLVTNQEHQYHMETALEKDSVGLVGLWVVGPESITARAPHCRIELDFHAVNVFLVLSGKSNEPITV